jgi:hypothetical protein
VIFFRFNPLSFSQLREKLTRMDAYQRPHHLLQAGDNRPPKTLMEDPIPYQTSRDHSRPVKPLDDPDFLGAEAALRRASAKAIAQDQAAGLEPVVAKEPAVTSAS